MEDLYQNKLEQLNKRVAILEEKVNILSQLFLQIGREIAVEVPKEDASKGVSQQFKDSVKADECKQDSYSYSKYASTEALPKETSPVVEDDKIIKSSKKFIAKYTSASTNYDICLDVGKNLIKSLKLYLDWKQIPQGLKDELYLEEAYEGNMYYADGEQIENDFVYFVAPAEPDSRYTQRDFIRLGLPQFYDIEYAGNLEGKLLKLLKPAVFTLDERGFYILKEKGELVLAR